MISGLAITGPTASGKTRLSLDIARELGCEIISCDSMQIYRGMDIGTAKATEEERALVPHHLIDITDPDGSYSAEEYRECALAAARDITERGKTPLFVGGTGMYLDTVMRGAPPKSPPRDPELSERLSAMAEDGEGRLRLYERLSEIEGRLIEARHKYAVEAAEDQQGKAEKHEIRVHQGIGSVYRGICKCRHAQKCHGHHDRKAAHLDKNNKSIS